jgi:arginine:agmatine antiporter
MNAGNAASSNRLGLGLATILVAGNLIGSGIYLLPATLGAVGSISIFGWLIATVGALLLAGIFSILMVARPTEGGLAVIAGEGLGEYWGFQSSILYWASCWIGNIAIALAVTGYLTVFLPALVAPLAAAASTALAIWVVTLVALRGPRAVGNFHSMTLAVGLIPLIAAGTLGWIWFDPSVFAQSWNVSGQQPSQAVYGSLLSVFWAFVGMESAVMVARMVRSPERNVPIATMGGVAIAAIVYMFATTAIMGVIPAGQLAASSAPFALVVQQILGPVAAALVAACALLKAAGTLGGWVLVTGETTRWTAAAGFFPRWLARSRSDGTPMRALLAMAVLMTAAVFATSAPTIGKQFAILINVTVVLLLVVYIYCSLALMRFSREFSPKKRKMALILAWLSFLFCGWLLASSEPTMLVVTAGLLAATLPAWWLIKGRRHKIAAALATEL